MAYIDSTSRQQQEYSSMVLCENGAVHENQLKDDTIKGGSSSPIFGGSIFSFSKKKTLKQFKNAASGIAAFFSNIASNISTFSLKKFIGNIALYFTTKESDQVKQGEKKSLELSSNQKRQSSVGFRSFKGKKAAEQIKNATFLTHEDDSLKISPLFSSKDKGN